MGLINVTHFAPIVTWLHHNLSEKRALKDLGPPTYVFISDAGDITVEWVYTLSSGYVFEYQQQNCERYRIYQESIEGSYDEVYYEVLPFIMDALDRKEMGAKKDPCVLYAYYDFAVQLTQRGLADFDKNYLKYLKSLEESLMDPHY